ncbi:hypothetical protein [Oceanicola sp. S124]|uniref:hypothetical protein n=1 Tax=Oceanicola sp. S124 TaxID=1042378 RepID=UPI0002FC0091|nr:hypothetical protein [Oceanicola sp. S124]
MDGLFRMIFNRLLRKGMNAGIDRVARDDPKARQRARQGRKMARNARQAQRVIRRLGKF